MGEQNEGAVATIEKDDVDVMPGLGEQQTYLVALDQQQLQTAHGQMIEWTRRTRAQVVAELKEERRALQTAVENKWAVAALRRRVALLEKRITFYKKIEAALAAGYVLVPNFDMNVFAIRTAAYTPRGGPTADHWRRFTQSPQLLPVGEGDYRSPEPLVQRQTETEPDGKGGTKQITTRWPVEFADVEFPMQLAKPVLMERTAQALRALVFDEVGVAVDTWRAGAKADPMILGRIRNPRTNRPAVTFFLAWYFDPSRL